jgi:hypothetical protein
MKTSLMFLMAFLCVLSIASSKSMLKKGDCGCEKEIHKKIIICDKPQPPVQPPVEPPVNITPPTPTPTPVQPQCQPTCAPEAQQMILVIPRPQPVCTPICQPETPVTVTPPPNINITPCNYHTDCCWWGMEVFPKSFWLDENNNAGRDYIVIQSGANSLQCDCDGNASVSQSLSDNNHFIPELIGGKIVALRSIYGGYLSMHADGSVDCKSHTICEENYFQIILSSNNCAQDAPNYVLFRAISGFYLSINSNGAIGAASYTDASFLFKGLLWNESDSLCNVVTTTPPVDIPTPETPKEECREVEITVPKRRRHKHKKTKKQEEEEIVTTTIHRRKVKPKKKVVEYEDEDYCDNDNDYDNDYEIKNKSHKSKKHKKHSKAKDADVYDSDEVYYVNHDNNDNTIQDNSNSDNNDSGTAQCREIEVEEDKDSCH